MKNLLILGSSGHAASVVEVVERMGGWRVVGLLDGVHPQGPTRLGYDIVGPPEDASTLVKRYQADGLVVAVGDNFQRRRLAEELRELVPGIAFPAAIHPAAVIAQDVLLGAGTVVMPGAIVHRQSRVGDFCIVNTRAAMDHDCALADYASLAPGVTLGGGVQVGELSALCIGATVAHNVRIGKQTVLGAGATLLHDLGDNVLAYGTPARVVRTRAAGERYL